MSSNTLNIVPQGWFSWDFTIMAESEVVAEVDISWWREKGELTVQGDVYKVYREGLMSGAFVLESGGVMIARAEKPNFILRSYDIEHEGKHYTLQASSAFRRQFVLLDGDREVGSIEPEGILLAEPEPCLRPTCNCL